MKFKKMMLLKSEKLFFLVLVVMVMALPASPASGMPVLKSGGEVLVELKGNDTVVIGGTEYQYKRIKKDKRLKIADASGSDGVFLKRFGTKIRLRDLQGNFLHYVLKARTYYKVKLGDGTELAYLKIENGKVLVKNWETNTELTVYPENGKVVFKDAGGNIVFTLEGETRAFPAAFLALEPLSPLERVACYLTYR